MMTSNSVTSRSKKRSRKAELAAGDLVALHRMMLRIRRAEERLSTLFSDGEVSGFIHLSIGQEAIATGVMSVLEQSDTVASNHRGHGHALAKGVALDGLFMEIMGRDTGICRGRGGSMHVADMSVGMLGANGIVGAGIPMAVGSAMAHQTRKTGAVAVAFFGDGALAQGVLHESLNLAALWNLPMLFVCENNGWSEFSPTSRQFVANVRELASAFGIESELVDGNDVEQVALAASRQVGALRAGKGPRVLECITRRVHGHYEGDPQKYRDDGDADPKTDPLTRSLARLEEAGADKSDIEAIAAEVEAEIDAAVDAARAAPAADFDAALADVYTRESG